MAGSYSSTGTYSNLTRLELEQLRRGDYAAGGKALTIGDSGLSPEGVVGKGNVNAEPFYTGPNIVLDDVYTLTPPSRPGQWLSSGQMSAYSVSGVPDIAWWYGVTSIIPPTSGGSAQEEDIWEEEDGSTNFVTAGVQIGDLLLIHPNVGEGGNSYKVGTIYDLDTDYLAAEDITGGVFDLDSEEYTYSVVRPRAARLFAVPGSGPLGAEQTFLFFDPASAALHSNPAPTLTQINNGRLKNIIPPIYGLDSTVDRADSVFGPPAPRTTLSNLGYRVIFYPDNGSGTGPDMSKPITAINPVINPNIPLDDQRITIDYKAGVVRMSCAPAVGGDIKVSGGTDTTTGRLNLYAVFWAFDQTFTKGSARSLYLPRSTKFDGSNGAAYLNYSTTTERWVFSSNGTATANAAYIQSVYPDGTVRFGMINGASSNNDAYISFPNLKMNRSRPTAGSGGIDDASESAYVRQYEVGIGEKTFLSVGSGTNPQVSAGLDYNPTFTGSGNNGAGLRDPMDALSAAIKEASRSQAYATVYLRRGVYINKKYAPIYVPPGVTLEGEGDLTVLQSGYAGVSAPRRPVLKVGPNTVWGVYDFDWDPTANLGVGAYPNNYPPRLELGSSAIEGVDVVYNSTRDVWGVFVAETTTNKIWFNELRRDGSWALAGLGLQVNPNSEVLFTKASSNSSRHTPGHYPRADHNPLADEYIVAWVKEITGPDGIGPRVYIQGVRTTGAHIIPTAYELKYGSPQAFGGSTYSTHPCVGVGKLTAPNYGIAIGCWTYNSMVSGWSIHHVLSSNFSDFAGNSSTTMGAATQVVTSFDVADDDSDGFCFVFTLRPHSVITGTNGNNSAGAFDDPAVSNWTTTGITTASTFVYLGSAASPDANRDGTLGQIVTVAAGNLTILQWDNNSTFPNLGSGINYAIVPTTKINSIRIYDSGFGSSVTRSVTDPTMVGSNTYALAPKDCDFVRISRGNGKFLVVYQGFEATGFLSRTAMQNFDGGWNTSFIDSGDIVLQDRRYARKFISTCRTILADNGTPIYPSPARVDVSSLSSQRLSRAGRDIEVSSRSLGAREPTNPYPNLGPDNFNDAPPLDLEISAQNILLYEGESLIPDVTWTGEDWTVVSPSRRNIKSNIGKYVVSGPNIYLTDPTFYFGDGSNRLDGAASRKTVEVGAGANNTRIWFPAANGGLGAYGTIAEVHSDHTVRLTAAVSGLVNGTRYAWTLNHRMNDTIPYAAGGFKNHGYRVAADGRVIMGSSSFTQADRHWFPVVGAGAANRNETIRRAKHIGGDLPTFNPPYFDNGSRVELDLGWQGPAIGYPKPVDERFPNDAPAVAIAWGGNQFVCLDRISGQTIAGGTLNQVSAYRQSLGPYKSVVKNLRLKGTGDRISTNLLRAKSLERVFTRHAPPPNSHTRFATDGYRMLFPKPYLQMGLYYNDRAQGAGTTTVQALEGVLTDSIGRSPQRLMGPRLINDATGGTTYDFFQSDQCKAANGAASADLNRLAPLSPGSPMAFWTGTNWLVVFIASEPLFSIFAHQQIYVCMLPGDEDSQSMQDWDLTGDNTNNRTVLAKATLSSGQFFNAGPGNMYQNMTMFDAAYSGKTLAVAWATGNNARAVASDSGGHTRGGASTWGVTLFDISGSGSSGVTYTFDVQTVTAATARGVFAHPKIVWDGQQFVALVAKRVVSGTSRMEYVTFSENGFGQPLLYRRASARLNSFNSPAVDYLGRIMPGTSTMSTQSSGLRCQPGDVITIVRAQDTVGPNADTPNFNGSYVVVDHNYQAGQVFLLYSNSFTTPTGNQYNVWGFVTPGGVTTVDDSHNYFKRATSTNTKPQPLATTGWAEATGITTVSGTTRILSFVYNDRDDEYAILFNSWNGSALRTCITSFKRNGERVKPVTVLPSFLAGVVGSMDWNGEYYCAVLVTAIETGDANAVLMNSNFEIVENISVSNQTQRVGGTSNNSIPGSLYGQPLASGSSVIQPELRDITIKWNPVLGRWACAFSWLWVYDQAVDSNSEELHGFPSTDIGSVALRQVSVYTNRTMTLSGATTKVQNGTRIAWVANSGATTCLTTVLDYNASTTLLTDLHSSETLQLPSLLSGTYTSATFPREDVFVFTLEMGAPLVELVDADDVTFSKVTLSGPGAGFSEYMPNMARPMWQAAGLHTGINQFPGRFSNFNHLLLNPIGKLQTLALENVKEMTSGKYKRWLSGQDRTFERDELTKRTK